MARQNVRRRGAWQGIRLWVFAALLLCVGCGGAAGQRVAIGLYDNMDLQALTVVPVSRGYRVLLDGHARPLPSGVCLRVSRDGARLAAQIDGQPLGCFRHVVVLHEASASQVRVEAEGVRAGRRIVDGNVSLTVDFQRIMCVNLVDMECYVAAVVLAEVGRGQAVELYKAQALLVRTYLLAHCGRHVSEGFNLCDQVHCQAYKESGWNEGPIREATLATQGQVVVDRDGRLISSVFHANCGGETASAEQVWLSPRSYLKGVRDQDCRGANGSRWEATVPLAAWRRFLQSKGIAASRLTGQQMAYRSEHRESLYTLPGGRGVPFRDLREYFNLRSAWFDVEVVGDEVLLHGRGYGHGIGMCQRGAMAKARRGYDAQRILKAYFTAVEVVPAERALPLATLEEE